MPAPSTGTLLMTDKRHVRVIVRTEPLADQRMGARMSINAGVQSSDHMALMVVSSAEQNTVLDDITADLFDLDARAVPVLDMSGSNTTTECTDNGCSRTCPSVGCTKGC